MNDDPKKPSEKDPDDSSGPKKQDGEGGENFGNIEPDADTFGNIEPD